MPFDIGDTINAITDKFLRAPVIKAAASNPIYTAMMITFIIILIIMFVFRDADTDDGLLTTTFRAGFWILLFMLTAITLHDKVLTTESSTGAKNEEYDRLFTGNFSATRTGSYDTLGAMPVPIRATEFDAQY